MDERRVIAFIQAIWCGVLFQHRKSISSFEKEWITIANDNPLFPIGQDQLHKDNESEPFSGIVISVRFKIEFIEIWCVPFNFKQKTEFLLRLIYSISLIHNSPIVKENWIFGIEISLYENSLFKWDLVYFFYHYPRFQF